MLFKRESIKGGALRSDGTEGGELKVGAGLKPAPTVASPPALAGRLKVRPIAVAPEAYRLIATPSTFNALSELGTCFSFNLLQSEISAGYPQNYRCLEGKKGGRKVQLKRR